MRRQERSREWGAPRPPHYVGVGDHRDRLRVRYARQATLVYSKADDR